MYGLSWFPVVFVSYAIIYLMYTNNILMFRSLADHSTIICYSIVLISYIGPGRKDTGDWCFSDGFITIEDISNLYTQFFKDKVLSIDADCSYSGKWVEYCKDFLDKVGVQPCGHSARKKRIKLKVRCSCQPDQIGSSLFYSVRGNGNDKNTGMCIVDRNKEVVPEQTCGKDFTEITCKKLPDETCALSPRFTF